MSHIFSYVYYLTLMLEPQSYMCMKLIYNTYVILPDVGAHLEVFNNMLEKAGVNLATLVIPEGLTIIQLGDLVHKGVQPLECLCLAYNMKQKNGDKYIQILGNHEAHYLGGPDLTGRAEVTHGRAETGMMMSQNMLNR